MISKRTAVGSSAVAPIRGHGRRRAARRIILLGCHPLRQSVDTPVARLIGRNPADIVTAMQRSVRVSVRTIMDRIAKAFTDDETKHRDGMGAKIAMEQP